MLRDNPVITLLPADDVERAKAFYAEKLKLPRAEIRVSTGDVAFAAGEGTVLYISDKLAGARAGHAVAGWHVEDIEEVVHELRDRGVRFEREQNDFPGVEVDDRGIIEVGDDKAAYFRDSEGNLLGLSQPAL